MITQLSDLSKIQPYGHLRIWEKETGRVLLDKHNAIHPENISYALANGLCGKSDGFIHEVCFGNGGARATSSNKFIFSVPQTIGKSATLYNQTYSKIVDTAGDTDNYTTVTHVSGNVYSDILIRCTLGQNEPADQPITNVNPSNNDIIQAYSFSEVGIKVNNGELISHICFYPIQKSQDLTFVLDYLIRIQIV